MPGGRPTDYDETYLDRVKELSPDATDQEVAEALNTHVSTLYRWQNVYPQFREALKLLKEPADDRVERSLYHRAIGYKHPAVKIFPPKGDGDPVIVPYIEHVAPDPTACIFWLKNRRKEAWRDRLEHVGADGKDLIPAMTEVDLAKWVAFVLTAGVKGG